MTSDRFLPGGYQGPHAGRGGVAPRRSEPVKRAGPFGSFRAHVQVVALEGGRPDWWQVEEDWAWPDGSTGTATCPIVGRDAALAQWRRRVAHYEAGGYPPE